MKRMFLSAVVLLTIASGSARAESIGGTKVPAGSWTYLAVAFMAKTGQIDKTTVPAANVLMTRDEFAAIVVRWFDSHPNFQNSLIDADTEDVVSALQREFADEIFTLDVRYAPLETRSIEGGLIAAPRHNDKRAHFLHRKQQGSRTVGVSPFIDFYSRIREAVQTDG